MMNLPGPEKGLIETLLSSSSAQQTQPQQAVLPGEIAQQGQKKADAASNSFAELIKAKAQDQKDQDAQKAMRQAQAAKMANAEQAAAPALVVPKDGQSERAQPESSKPGSLGTARSFAEDATAEIQKKETKATEKDEKADVQAMAQASTQLSAAQVGIAQNAGKEAQAKRPESKQNLREEQSATKAVTTQAQGAVGPKAPGTLEARQPMNKMGALETKQLRDAIAQAEPELKAAGQSQVERRQPESPVTVVQPIVIQVPMMAPQIMTANGPMAGMGKMSDSIELDDDSVQMLEVVPNRDQNGLRKLVASQDFVAERGSILGVDRPDPRLVGRVSRELEERQSPDLTDGSKLHLLMPQVGGQHAKAESLTTTTAAATGSAQAFASLAPLSREAVNVANPMALAAQVRGLAASGGGVVRMKVMPESLGEVTISVKQERGQKLDVSFDAASPEAREALASSLPELRKALESNRFQVGEVSITSSSARLSSLNTISADSGSAMNQWSNQFGQQSAFNSDQQGNSQNQNAETGWDRYFEQRDGYGRNSGQGRQQSGYRRYQDSQYLS